MARRVRLKNFQTLDRRHYTRIGSEHERGRALLNNRGLKAEYNALGLSEAEYVEESLPPSPTVSLERVAWSGDLHVERRLIADLLQRLTLPKRTKMATTEFRATQHKAIAATFRPRPCKPRGPSQSAPCRS